MDDHARRLVERDELGVLVKDAKGNLLGLRKGRLQLRQRERERLPPTKQPGGPHGGAIDEHATLVDEGFDARTRQLRFSLSEKDVEALTSRLGGYTVRSRSHGRQGPTRSST